MAKVELYNYKATVLRVLDGDTVEVQMDLGFNISVNTLLRLNGIDTPEIHSKNPLEAITAIVVKHKLEDMILNKEVILKTIKYDDKYGRYLSDIYMAEGESINCQLIKGGWCKAYSGDAKTPWTDDELIKINNLR